MDGRESETLAAARRGDRSAFDRLCQSHRDDLIALCLRFVGNRDDAEDIVQETFARAWQSLERFRGDAGLRTWFWEIARNGCLNHLRARKSRLQKGSVSIDADEALAGTLQDTQPGPEEEALDREAHEQLRRAIQQGATDRGWLATDWKLFLGRIQGDLSYAEFAREHGRDEAYWRNRWRDKIKPTLEMAGRKAKYPAPDPRA